MKNIIKSLLIVVAVAAIAGGATYAYFSSQATITNNTFSTGTLKITVDGQPTLAGFSFPDAKPGDCKEGKYGVNNYGSPYFAGPSTLTAKTLTVKLANKGGNGDLCDALTFDITKSAGGTPEAVYSGNFNGFATEQNLLLSYYSGGLIPGSTIDMNYKICLPENGDQSALQGKTCTFDFVAEGRTN